MKNTPRNKYDKFNFKLKNNVFIVIILFLFVIVIGISNFLDSASNILAFIQNEAPIDQSNMNLDSTSTVASDTSSVNIDMVKEKNKDRLSIDSRENESTNAQVAMYTNRVFHKKGNPISGVVVRCSNCREDSTLTNSHGQFTLTKNLDNMKEFLFSEIEIELQDTLISTIINWREKSPQTIFIHE